MLYFFMCLSLYKSFIASLEDDYIDKVIVVFAQNLFCSQSSGCVDLIIKICSLMQLSWLAAPVALKCVGTKRLAQINVAASSCCSLAILATSFTDLCYLWSFFSSCLLTLLFRKSGTRLWLLLLLSCCKAALVVSGASRVLGAALSSEEIHNSAVPCLLTMLLSRNMIVDMRSIRLSLNKW